MSILNGDWSWKGSPREEDKTGLLVMTMKSSRLTLKLESFEDATKLMKAIQRELLDKERKVLKDAAHTLISRADNIHNH